MKKSIMQRVASPIPAVAGKMLCVQVLLASLACIGSVTAQESSQILYLLKSKNNRAAFELYEKQKNLTGQHDLELVEEIGFTLLDQGYRSQDLETQMLTLLGAGISGNDRTLYILKHAIKSQNPQLQSVAIHLVNQFQHDDATELLNVAMASNSAMIRLEALLGLIKKKHPKASGQIEALMQKVSLEAMPIFPQLLAMCGDQKSIKALKKLLLHPSVAVRVEAVLATARYGRDDLLSQLRKLSSHFSVAEQEACAAALGHFKDDASVHKLKFLTNSSTLTVKLAALYALYQMGHEEVKADIERLANIKDLFAISLLGKIPGSEKALIGLIDSEEMNVRINASLSLLKLSHPDCISGITEVLIQNNKDFAFSTITSYGGSLSAWKSVPCACENFSNNSFGFELSLRMREDVLAACIELEENIFLTLAGKIFESEQNDLIPLLTKLLASLHSDSAMQLLKRYREKVGAPLIRNYCNLALFRAKEPGPYRKSLRAWVTTHCTRELIQFRPSIPWEQRRQHSDHHQISLEETSRLLVESFEALVQSKDEEAIDILLTAIRNGREKNAYALAGLLMRASH